MAIAYQQASSTIIRPIYPLPEAAPQVLLDLWCTKFGDKKITIAKMHLEGEAHPDWLVEQMLKTLAHRPCIKSVVDYAVRWNHPDFLISAHEDFIEEDLRLYIRPKTKKEPHGDR